MSEKLHQVIGKYDLKDKYDTNNKQYQLVFACQCPNPKITAENRSAVARLQHETIKACEKLKIWWNDDNTMNADLKGFSN